MVKTRRQELEDSYDGDDLDERAGRRSRRSGLGWFLPRLAVMLVLLAVCAWFAPAIAAKTGLWKTIVATAAPDYAGKIDARGVSLGWLSPVSLEGAVVLDDQGQPLAEVASVTSGKSLLELLQASGDYGKFTLNQPRAVVVVRSDGSNVEDFLATLPQSDSPTPQFELEVVGGRVDVQDVVAGRTWTLTGINSRLLWPTAGQRQGNLSATVAEIPTAGAAAPPAAGELAADFTWEASAVDAAPAADSAESSWGAGTARAVVRGLPTGAIEPLLRRLNIDIQSAGPLHADLAASWKNGGRTAELDIRQLRAPQWTLASNQYLGGDRLQLAVNGGRGQITLDDDRLTVRDLHLDSDLVQLQGQGSASLQQLASSASQANAAAPEDLAVRGQLNLAALATQLPQLFRLRADARLTAGQVSWSLETKQDGNSHRWIASLEAGNLAAETARGPITWSQPISLAAAVVQANDGWRIEQLHGDAKFLQLEGSGTLRQGSISASANLNQLVADLGQIIDWRGIQLAGNLGANLHWKQGEGNSWQATAKADVRNFQFYREGMMPWREDDLRLQGTVDGVLDGNRLKNVTAGQVSVVSGSDRCDAELTAMVPELSAATKWPMRFVVKGDLATWLPRIQAFFPAVTTRPGGTIQLTGSGHFSPEAATFESLAFEAQELALDVAGLTIREPVVRLDAAGVFDVARRQFSSPQMTLASTAIALRGDKLLIDLTPDAMMASGTIDYRGDLERLSSWLVSPYEPRPWQLGGSLMGSVEAKYTQGVVQATWNTDIEQLSYSTPAPSPARPPLANVSTAPQTGMQPQWVEPRVTLKGRGQYDPKSDSLQIASNELTSSALGLAIAGKIDGVSSACITDLQGEIYYDGVSVSEKLRPLLGPTLQITGKEQRKFALRGPLFPPAGYVSPKGIAPLVHNDLQGQGSVAWQEVKFVGLTAGAAEVPAGLSQGVITFGPLNIPVSEGRIAATPRVALNEATPTLMIDRGQVVDQVRLSPEICHTWLKYVAPLLADATRAEGKFSVGLSGAAVPLTQPEKADVAGSLVIHRAEVGPGPLAQQYLALARQVRGLVERNPNIAPLIDPEKGVLVLPEQQLDFQVIDGRVHHRGLKMTVKDVVITTHGSVGFDQTIDLVANIPVQDSWVQSGSPLAALRGQSIAIPIRGDLKNPKPDAKALADLGTNLIRGAAQNAIEKELNKGLQRLFGPVQPQSP